MAPVDVRCECGKLISVAAKHRGRAIKCKQCGRPLTVPPARRGVGSWRAPAQWVRSRSHARLVTAASWAYAGGAVLVAALIWGFGDAWWPGTILLFIGRWIFLMPLAGLVPALLATRNWRAVLPLVAGTLVVLGPVVGVRTGWRRLAGMPDGTPLRVVTFNAGNRADIALMLPVILDEWQADVVAFQECGPDLVLATTYLDDWHRHNVRQLCFLSRHRIADSAVMDRSAFARIEESEYAGIGGSGDVARYRVMTPGGPVTITNLHLETPRKGLEGLLGGTFNAARLRDNTALRTFEAQRARQWVDGGGSPSIVMGDFNTPAESRIYRAQWGAFTNAFARAGFGFGMTRHNGWIRVRIDHVLTGDGVVPVRVRLGRPLGSDHLPVIADLVVTRAPGRSPP